VQARWPEIKNILEEKGYQPMAISAVAHIQVRELLWKASELLRTAPVLAAEEVEMPVYRPADDPRAFTIEHTSEGWQVRGAAVERAAAMTYWEYDGSVRRFQRLMATLGIEDELRKAGVQEGETVFIGDYELEWQD
jgi:GTP-binding protein